MQERERPVVAPSGEWSEAEAAFIDGDMRRARRLFRAVLASSPCALVAGIALSHLGQTYPINDRRRSEYLKQAAGLLSTVPDALDCQFSVLVELVAAYLSVGRIRKAAGCVYAAIGMARTLGGSFSQAALLLIAEMELATGNVDSALSVCLQDQAVPHRCLPQEVRYARLVSRIYAVKEEYEAAMRYKDTETQLVARLFGRRSHHYASVVSSAAFIKAEAGELAAALGMWQEAVELLEELGPSFGAQVDDIVATIEDLQSRSSSPLQSPPEREDADMCLVCMERPNEAGLLHGDSMHAGFCLRCACRVEAERRCPICQRHIERVVRVFN